MLALDHEARKLAEDLNRVQSRLSHARLELDRIARDRVLLEENGARDRQSLAERETERTAEESSFEEARERQIALQTEVAQLSEDHATRRANLAGVEERARAVAAARFRLEGQIREVIHRRAHLEGEIQRLEAEKAQLLASNSELQTRSGQIQIEVARAEEAASALEHHETELRRQLATAEEDLKASSNNRPAPSGTNGLNTRLNSRGRKPSISISMRRANQELGIGLAQLVEQVEELPDEVGLDEIEAQYSEVRRKIENLGPVNATALEEFEEAQQRQEFLSAQRQDLIDSIRDTEKAIHEIDSESRKRFSEAFEAINANFKEMFATLFGGGTGEMRLTDEENLAESGIDIVASPPGKRLQSVLLLSGGEKALTAMALLMSIFQYTPSPFCVLDEVDAPLDEPNIERLTRLLKEMSEETQFIVITHAKRTMEAAQSLYGVTMQEPGSFQTGFSAVSG